MKKLVLAVLVAILVFMSAEANDLHLYFEDAISAADTVAAAIRTDTAYSNIHSYTGFNRFQFFYTVLPYNESGRLDTSGVGWVGDWYFIELQHSFDKTNWHDVTIDSIQDTTIGIWDALNYNTTDSIIGNWFRLQYIHTDSMEAAGAGINGNSYWQEVSLWISPKN